jgi:hypothetical protein
MIGPRMHTNKHEWIWPRMNANEREWKTKSGLIGVHRRLPLAKSPAMASFVSVHVHSWLNPVFAFIRVHSRPIIKVETEAGL